MSLKVQSYVWEHSPSKGSELIVLLALADRARDNGLAWPGIDELATKARVSRRQVQRILRDLESRGEIVTVLNSGRANTNYYRIVIGDTDVTISEEEKGDIRDLEKVTSRAEKVTPVTRKGDTGVARTVRNRQEPLGGTSLTENAESERTHSGPEEERESDPPAGDVALVPTNGRNERLQGFRAFWDLYPKKSKRPSALSAWNWLNPDRELTERILEAVRLQTGANWKGQTPRFIPDADRWLRDERWEDDIYDRNQPEAVESGPARTKSWHDEARGGTTVREQTGWRSRDEILDDHDPDVLEADWAERRNA